MGKLAMENVILEHHLDCSDDLISSGGSAVPIGEAGDVVSVKADGVVLVKASMASVWRLAADVKDEGVPAIN